MASASKCEHLFAYKRMSSPHSFANSGVNSGDIFCGDPQVGSLKCFSSHVLILSLLPSPSLLQEFSSFLFNAFSSGWYVFLLHFFLLLNYEIGLSNIWFHYKIHLILFPLSFDCHLTSDNLSSLAQRDKGKQNSRIIPFHHHTQQLIERHTGDFNLSASQLPPVKCPFDIAGLSYEKVSVTSPSLSGFPWLVSTAHFSSPDASPG